MFTFAILKEHLRSCHLRSSFRQERGLIINNIQFLTPGQDAASFHIHTLYIGTAEDLLAFLEARTLPAGTMLLLSGDSPKLDPLFQDSRCYLLSCSASPLTISNVANSCYFEFSQWISNIRALAFRSKNVQTLLDEIADRLHLPVFLVNGGYRLIASNVTYSFENPYIHQLLTDGYLSDESIDALMSGNVEGENAPDLFEAFLEPNCYTVLSLLRYHAQTFGRILFVSEGYGSNAALLDYIKSFSGLVREHTLMNNREQFESDTEFSSLISDLIDRRISGEEELESRLFRLPVLPSSCYRCIVVAFEENHPSQPTGLIIRNLTKLFPSSNIAVYQSDLILFAKASPDSWEVVFDQDQLQHLLERYHAYAAIGNRSSFISSIRPIYLQTRAAITLGRVLHQQEDNRIFYYDDFTAYHLIDLCGRLGYEFHEDNLIYLCTPRFTALMRHDRKNKDNLCQILRAYIHNNCNTTKTSKELFLHRNTVINKIAKIEEIIGCPIDNWNIQLNLMLSSMVMEYAEKYRETDLLEPKRKLLK